MKKRVINLQYLPSDEEQDPSKTLKSGGFLWPGFTHSYPVWSKQIASGRYRYQTGLVPLEAPEDKREEIQAALDELEAYYGKGVLDPLNESFWKDIKLVVNKKNMFLDITSNMEHKLIYYVIKGHGIFEVAPSFDEAKDSAQPKKWYLVEPEEFANISASTERSFNKAVAALEDLDENQTFDDIFLVHKALITSDRGTTKQTPRSALYKDLSDFIYGKIVKTEKRKTPKQFIDTVSLIKTDKKKLYVTGYVKDAVYFRFITATEDGSFINVETRTKYGSSVERVVDYLCNPVNQTELDNVKERVEKKWSE